VWSVVRSSWHSDAVIYQLDPREMIPLACSIGARVVAEDWIDADAASPARMSMPAVMSTKKPASSQT
jgi:hypothetical protein